MPIFDRIENAGNYIALHPLYARAFAYLQEALAEEPELGEYTLQGDELSVVVMSKPCRSADQAPLEAHRHYIDIHFVVSGMELVGWKYTADCAPKTDYDQEKDVILFSDEPEQWVAMQAGTFAIFDPQTAHAPLVGEGLVQKAVVKVRLVAVS